MCSSPLDNVPSQTLDALRFAAGLSRGLNHCDTPPDGAGIMTNERSRSAPPGVSNWHSTRNAPGLHLRRDGHPPMRVSMVWAYFGPSMGRRGRGGGARVLGLYGDWASGTLCACGPHMTGAARAIQ